MRSSALLLWLLTLTLFIGESFAVGYLAESNAKFAIVESGANPAPVSREHHRVATVQANALADHTNPVSDHLSACEAMAGGDEPVPHGDKNCSCSAGACDCIINLGLAMPAALAVSTAPAPQHSVPSVPRYGSIPSKEWHPPFRPPIA